MDSRPILSRQVKPLGLLLALLMLLSICMPASAQTGIVFSAQYYTWKHGKVKPKQKFYHLYLTRPDGTHPHLLTSGAFDDMYPKWSYDHKQIAFLRRYPSGSSYLCTLSLPSRHISRLYRLGSQEFIDFVWSPSRNLIALHSRKYYSGSDSAVHSFVVLAGGRQIVKFKDADEFVWAPDGSHIYLHRDDAYGVLNIATHQFQSIPILENPVWINNHTLLGVITKPPDNPASENYFRLLDLNTRKLMPYLLVVHHRAEYYDDPLESGVDLSWCCSPTNKKRFALDITYHISDGDHHWCYMAMFSSFKGVANSVGGEYPFGVAFGGFSPSGTEFACYSAEWVGGYKRTGAQLGPLEIRNLAGKRIKFVTCKMVQILGASWY